VRLVEEDIDTYLDLPVLEINFGIGHFKVDVRRDLGMLESENAFDQAGYTSSALKMTNVGLD
jgi:hypothetical protein